MTTQLDRDPGHGPVVGRVARRRSPRVWARVVAGLVASAVAFASFAAATDRAAACDALVVPSIDLERCVVAGGQSEIDAGRAVRMDVLSTDSVHWIAGHRTTHGGTFSSLTSIALRDLVAYRGGVYRVEQHIVVDRFVDTTAFAWIASGREALILQTSASGSNVHFWYAPKTAEPFVVAQSPAVPAPPAGAPPEAPVTPVEPTVRSTAPTSPTSPRRGDGKSGAALAARTSALRTLLQLRAR